MKPLTPEQPACVACGHYHGGVNAELLCLRAHLTAARARATQLEEQIAEMKRPAQEYYSMRQAKPVTP